MMGLRLKKGVDIERLRLFANFTVNQVTIENLIKQQLIIKKDNTIVLTDTGFNVSNEVISVSYTHLTLPTKRIV